jgi:hypothetical protein
MGKISNNPVVIVLKEIDPTGLGNAISDCESTSNDKGRLACARSVLKVVSKIEPTGLTGIASALMAPICDV